MARHSLLPGLPPWCDETIKNTSNYQNKDAWGNRGIPAAYREGYSVVVVSATQFHPWCYILYSILGTKYFRLPRWKMLWEAKKWKYVAKATQFPTSLQTLLFDFMSFHFLWFCHLEHNLEIMEITEIRSSPKLKRMTHYTDGVPKFMHSFQMVPAP